MKQFNWEEFTKSDLEDGMVVEYRNGDKILVLNDCLFGVDGHYKLEEYKENMEEKDEDFSGLDIIRVFKIIDATTLLSIFDKRNLVLIWERTEPKKMTVEEMRKKLEEMTGVKIEVVPSDDE